MVCDTHMSPAASRADVVLPGTAPINTSGSYINTERRFQVTKAALKSDAADNMSIIRQLAAALEINLEMDSDEDIIREMNREFPWYRKASEGEIIDGVLAPSVKVLVPVSGDCRFADPVKNPDYLKNLI